MLKEGRPGLTEEQKVDMWRRWKAGYSIREICLALKRNSSPVYQQLAIRGGIAPSGHIRAVVLKMAERKEISRGLSSGESFRSIAGRLGRAPAFNAPSKWGIEPMRGFQFANRTEAHNIALERFKRTAQVLDYAGLSGGPCRDRTYDQLIKRSLHGYNLNL
jgi:Helix-turn-helix domain